MFNLEEALRNLPEHPGVYIMKNSEGEIIYIGKAISLKNRVRQYFQSSKNHSPKVITMVKHIAEFEYILVASELEALILECNLIKKHKPRYNIRLKDDKHYPFIKVTINEEYPRVIVTRRVLKDGAKYFGPYSDSYAVRDTIQTIKKMYPVRSCNKDISQGKKVDRPCLNYHIKRCLGPCQGNVDREIYMAFIKDILMLLSGKHDELVNELKERMMEAAKNLNFEMAAKIRDEINSIGKIQEKQRIISSSLQDEDIIAFAHGEYGSCIEVFFIREGKLLGRENFYFDDVEEKDEEMLSQFITQFYSEREYIPKEILIQTEIPRADIIQSYLASKRGSRVNLRVPMRGDKNHLLDMARKNAEAALEQQKYKNIMERKMSTGAIEELQMILNLDKLPYRIEAFDISNIQGTNPVASMVVFEGGKPKNKDYRRFKIKSVQGPNDYASMEEIIRRRFKRGIEEIDKLKSNGEEEELNRGKFSTMPDLILIDGGEGQVSSAKRAMEELGVVIPTCGMVKDDRHRTRGLVYNGEEISIYKDSSAFKLITRIQDEAHRFAIEYHRSLRSKGSTLSVLDEINGIGKKRRTALLKHFGGIDGIKKAAIDELKGVDGMNEVAAKAVYNFFNNK